MAPSCVLRSTGTDQCPSRSSARRRVSRSAELSQNYGPDGSREYPDAADGWGQVVPEVIATSRVPAGNTADNGGSKRPTEAHSFGAISAYDGHRAGVGRVVCDATWHHFINVNLIGVVEGGIFDQFDDPGRSENPAKHNGFLSSAQGLAALDKIKNYYTNIDMYRNSPSGSIASAALLVGHYLQGAHYGGCACRPCRSVRPYPG